ncbi:MAG: single-stranded DNA-binding protein [Actinomycetota bacterium]
MTDNTITVIGNVTREPELKFLNSGQASVRLSLAVNRRWQNRATQEWEERVSYFEVSAYAQLAENIANSITKGTRVIVTGRLEQRSWETPEGDKRSIVEINADEVAPSLRYATTTVTKNPKAEGASYPSNNSGRAAAPVANQPSSYAFDEEPF